MTLFICTNSNGNEIKLERETAKDAIYHCQVNLGWTSVHIRIVSEESHTAQPLGNINHVIDDDPEKIADDLVWQYCYDMATAIEKAVKESEELRAKHPSEAESNEIISKIISTKKNLQEVRYVKMPKEQVEMCKLIGKLKEENGKLKEENAELRKKLDMKEVWRASKAWRTE